MRITLFSTLLIGLLALTISCDTAPEVSEPLPIIGPPTIVGNDTIPHQIPDFGFLDQDSTLVTNATFAGKAYIADFFFISCPTICPKVKKSMLRIRDSFPDGEIMLLSHSIDPKRDTVGRLKQFAQNLGVDDGNWRFVTGEKDSLYAMTEPYMSLAIEDPEAPGGFDHSGWILLVDENRHIRSFANGTEPEAVDKLILDIKQLLRE